MIKVTIGNNVDRKSFIVDPATTIGQVIADSGYNFSRGTTHLDGSTIREQDMGKTFADFGITEKCFLLNVVKADNA